MVRVVPGWFRVVPGWFRVVLGWSLGGFRVVLDGCAGAPWVSGVQVVLVNAANSARARPVSGKKSNRMKECTLSAVGRNVTGTPASRARSASLLEYQRLEAGLPQGDGRGQAAGAAACDDHAHVDPLTGRD